MLGELFKKFSLQMLTFPGFWSSASIAACCCLLLPAAGGRVIIFFKFQKQQHTHSSLLTAETAVSRLWIYTHPLIRPNFGFQAENPKTFW